MALIDHSFHDFDVNQWVSNFDSLTEPEYILRSLDELVLSKDSDEFRALIRKGSDSYYDKIVDVLRSQDAEKLFIWALYPKDFISDSGIVIEDERYLKFLSELIPGFIMYKNQWDRNQLGKEIRNFIQNLQQPYIDRPTRLKKCVSCGYNLTDWFAAKLTADNILDDTPVAVVCPHCNLLNYIKY